MSNTRRSRPSKIFLPLLLGKPVTKLQPYCETQQGSVESTWQRLGHSKAFTARGLCQLVHSFASFGGSNRYLRHSGRGFNVWVRKADAQMNRKCSSTGRKQNYPAKRPDRARRLATSKRSPLAKLGSSCLRLALVPESVDPVPLM